MALIDNNDEHHEPDRDGPQPHKDEPQFNVKVMLALNTSNRAFEWEVIGDSKGNLAISDLKALVGMFEEEVHYLWMKAKAADEQRRITTAAAGIPEDLLRRGKAGKN